MADTYEFLKGLRLMDWQLNAILKYLEIERPSDPEIELSDHKALFVPQKWIDDDAVRVDAEGQAEWIVSQRYLENWDAYAAKLGLDDSVLYESTAYNDEFKNDPAAPEWVRLWRGPFEVEVWKMA